MDVKVFVLHPDTFGWITFLGHLDRTSRMICMWKRHLAACFHLPNKLPTLRRLLQDSSRAKCSGRVLQDTVKTRRQMSREGGFADLQLWTQWTVWTVWTKWTQWTRWIHKPVSWNGVSFTPFLCFEKSLCFSVYPVEKCGEAAAALVTRHSSLVTCYSSVPVHYSCYIPSFWHAMWAASWWAFFLELPLPTPRIWPLLRTSTTKVLWCSGPSSPTVT